MQARGAVAVLWNFLTLYFRVLLLGSVLSCVGWQAAQAQTSNVDWLVNVNDAGFDPVSAGGAVEYVIDVDNNGSVAAPPTTIDVSIPATTRLTSITGDFTGCQTGGSPVTLPLLGPAMLTCNLPSVPALSTPATNVSSVFTLVTLQQGVIELEATVPVTGDDQASNNTLAEETTVRAGSDLALTLTADAAVASGSFINFDISVLNNGPNTANSFTIEFPIPTGVTNLTGPGGASLPSGCVVSGGVATCTITGSVLNGNAITRSFQGQVIAAGGSTITSSASVLNSSPNDPISSNNTQTVNTIVNNGTDLEVEITRPGSGGLLLNDTVRYTITSAYSGNTPSGLSIETTIPSNLSLDAVSSPDGWTCAPLTPARVLNCTRPDPTTGQGLNVSLGSIFIDTTVDTAGTATIETEIAGTSPVETNFSNNADSITETITAATVDLRANKSGPDPRIAVVGSTIEYRISTSNVGTADFVGAVRMVDTLPPGLTVVGTSGAGWSCVTGTNGSGQATVTCDLTYTSGSPLASGDRTPTVTINALVGATATGTLVNTMTVSTPGASDETNLGNNTTSYSVDAQATSGDADLGVNQYVALSSVAAGDIQTVYIEVTNTGPATSNDVRVNEIFRDLINSSSGPTGAGFVSSTITPGVATGASCSSAPSGGPSRSLSCSIAQVPVCTPGTQASPGAAPTGGTCPVIAVQIRPGGPPGARSHRVAVSSISTPDPNTANQRATINYNVIGDIDITVAKSVVPDPAVAGQNVTYVVTATNLSADAGSVANAVTITDTLPDNVRFISAVPSAGSCGTQPAANAVTSGSQVICDLGSIDGAGGQQTVTIEVRPTNITRGTPLTNNVTVASPSEPVTNQDNNSASAVVGVTAPSLDILINKDDSVDPVLVGQTTVYTLTVTNAGPSASENVVVTDVLPDSIFAYRSHTVSGDGTCGTVPVPQVTPDPNPANRTLECSFPYLPVDQPETIQVTMEAVSQGTIPNEVTISSDEIVAGFDRESANNRTSETTTARRRADISVTSKIPSQPNVNLRDTFDFVIRVANNPDIAGFEAADVVVTDTLPTGMEVAGTISVSVTQGSLTQTTCTSGAGNTAFSCNFGTASADAVALITVPTKVVAMTTANQAFTNTARVTTTSFDSNPSNNEASGMVTSGSSSLAGTVYRDFNNSATPTTNGQDEARDTGIAGVTMTLTGTAVDGATITETAVTDGNGDYIFPFLPQGTYQVSLGPVSEPGLSPGQNTLGSVGGTLAGGSLITSIPLPATTAAVDYDFAEIPAAEAPAINLVKSASLAALSNPPQVGEIVSYSFAITNTGNVPLSNVTLVDPVPGVTLTGSPIPSLAPGQTNTTAYSATYALQSGDIGGQISNTATVTGTPPTGGDVSDTDTTNTSIPTFTPVPNISLNKTVNAGATADGAEVGDILTYGFTITNTGNIPLTNVTITDPLPGINVIGSPIPLLNPGATNTTAYTATYSVTQADILARGVTNTATVTGTPQGSGGPVTDNDTEVVEFLNIDAVPEVFPPFTDGGTTTTMLASDRVEGQPATLGNVTLTVLREDPGVTLDPVTTLITLEPGLPAGRYEVDYRICSIAVPGLCDEATEVVVQGSRPTVETTKTQELVDNGDGSTGVGDTIVYQITLENTGNIALDNVTILDTLRDKAGGSLTLTSGPTFVSSSSGSPEGELAVGEMATYSATFVINDQAVAAGGVDNTVDGGGFAITIEGVPTIPERVNDISDDGDDLDGNTTDDPTELALTPTNTPGTTDPTDLVLSKTTTRDVVRRGDVVPYTVTVTNGQTTAVGPVTLRDTLPPGFVFVAGSASLTPTTVTAGQITWEGISLPAGGSLEVTLSARVLSGARAGEHINRANLLDPATGDPLVPEATATVRLLPEAVFDCGEVIGKVFVDLDGDGHQDGPNARDGSITDQTFDGGKGAPAPKTEVGLPNVRLVTVDGSVITTDQYGRYSVPCAMLPENTGSNFILKLDDRTLPTGYRVTTENPRVMRLTPGMMTELNFGARVGRVVRVDLGAAAFGLTSEGKVVLSPALKRGVAQLLPQLDGAAETLRLTFHVPAGADAEDVKAARKMMQATARHIKQEWRKTGGPRLLVEQTIARAGQ